MFKSRYTALFGVMVTSFIFYSPISHYFSGYELITEFPSIKTFFDTFSFYYIEETPQILQEARMYANIPYNRFFAGLGYEVSCTMFLLSLYFLIRFIENKRNIDLLIYCLTIFTVFSFHGGGAIFLLPASLLVIFNSLLFGKLSFWHFKKATGYIILTVILGNLWMLAMFKYGLLLDVGDALPILDELLGTKKQAVTVAATGKEIMQNTKTGRTIQQVSIEPMDAAKEAAFRKTLKGKK